MKMTKAAADYTPNAKSERCKECTMFREDTNTCTLVGGRINPQGHCKYFERQKTKMKVTNAN